ncbi:MAG TPA: alanine racemase [Candidatus Saccharimonadales bacterium]|jgi:D-serine deaminase-like pyridoxal phosphate-dependent protein|nr:alanine racemase [Candidatus Saccharimonadales bacterium]
MTMNLSLTDPEITTPAFLVEEAVVQQNCAIMREKARNSGVGFRPHVKTHKTVEIARMQLGPEGGPITVSTLAEAEFFAAHGFDDITYAVPLSPDKLGRAAALASRIQRMNVLIDSFAVLRAMEEFAALHGHVFHVFLKVDCGYHRAGVDPESEEGMRLALALAGSQAVRLEGLLTHAGHSYYARGIQEVLQVGREETSVLTRFRDRLAAQGVTGLLRSTGSTPTTSAPERLSGTDEIRPGNYTFYDAFQSGIGVCRLSQCAVSVLSTVIGSYPQHGHLLVDAGALALSKDAGPDHIDSNCGFGVVCDLSLNRLPLNIKGLSQEHGKIEGAPEAIARFPIGTRMRIIPNHSCLTAALFPHYQVVRNGMAAAQWEPVRGW